MIAAITLALAQAAVPTGMTYLECTELDGKVWSITINHVNTSVSYGLIDPPRQPSTTRRTLFKPDSVIWEVGGPHPVTGEQPLMAVNRTTMKFMMTDMNMRGQFKGWRYGRCEIVEVEDRVF